MDRAEGMSRSSEIGGGGRRWGSCLANGFIFRAAASAAPSAAASPVCEKSLSGESKLLFSPAWRIARREQGGRRRERARARKCGKGEREREGLVAGDLVGTGRGGVLFVVRGRIIDFSANFLLQLFLLVAN